MAKRAKPKPKVIAKSGQKRQKSPPVPATYQSTQPAVPKAGVVSSAGSYFGVSVLGGMRNSFTPTPYNPDELANRKGIRIYRKMYLEDEQVKAALNAKKYAVLSTGYEIRKPELPDQETDKAVDEYTDFAEFNLNEMKGSFESKLLDIMTAMVYGYSVTEQVYWKIDYGPFEGMWGVKDLKTRPPDDIEFEMDSAGDLTQNGVWQNMVKMPAWKFIIYSHNGTFGNYYGESDLRAAYRAYWCKDNVMRMLPIALERYAEPIATATYKGIIDDDQRYDLEQFLKNLQTRSGIILPEAIVLQLLQPPQRAGEAFMPALDYYDQLIRVAIMMPGLMGLSGEQQTGSFARAVKEFDAFLWILNQLRRDIETVINEQLVKPLLDFNYDIEHGMYPLFKFKEVTEEARQRQFELFLMGLSAGALTKGPEDEGKLRDLINFEPLPQEITDQQAEIDQANMDNELEMAKAGGPMALGQPTANGNGAGPQVPKASGNGNGNQPPKPTADKQSFSAEQEAQLIEYVESLRG